MEIKIIIYSKPKFIKLRIPVLTQIFVTLKHALSLLSLSLLPLLLLLESAAEEDGDNRSNNPK